MDRWSSETGLALGPDDWIRYLAGVTGYASFQRFFESDLTVPGVRVPVSCKATTVQTAQLLGDVALWAHTLGARGSLEPVDDLAGGAWGRPEIVVPPALENGAMPSAMAFDAANGAITIGGIGRVEGVSEAVWTYTTSGMPVLRKWFGYRKAVPAGRNQEILTGVFTDRWYPEWTSELEAVLTGLSVLVNLEPSHEELLGLLDSEPLMAFPA